MKNPSARAAPNEPAPLCVFSTLATKVALAKITERCEVALGRRLDITFAPTAALMERIRGGAQGDLAILTQEAIRALEHDEVLCATADVAISQVGIAVKAGAAKPDISTVEDLRSTLLSARSIAYSRIGASGIYFAGLIEKLAIASQVNAKATIIPGGFTAELAARGDVELAVQQVSELLAVPGIEVIGALPDAVASASMFSAGVFRASREKPAAEALLRQLVSPETADAFRASGLEPA